MKIALRLLRHEKCPGLIPNHFWNDEDFVRRAMKEGNGRYLQHVSKGLQCDFEIALAAVGGKLRTTTYRDENYILSFLKDYNQHDSLI